MLKQVAYNVFIGPLAVPILFEPQHGLLKTGFSRRTPPSIGHSMAAVSRRLARADGVSIVIEHAKRYDTCSEARTAPRVGSTCLTEASACFAYAVRQRGSPCTAYVVR